MIRLTTAALTVVVLASCACSSATAGAKPDLAYRHEVTALWSFDYWGYRVRNDADIAPYHREFAQILRSCQINRENLTNLMIELADKASFQGNRYVTTLMMMRAVTRRITWTGRAPCARTFNLAEGHMEAGGP